MDAVTRLVLVRHGEAICNVTGVVGGPKGCTGLTSLGRAQASKVAGRLARTGELGHVSALYASVLRRAVETAQILAPGLATHGETPPPVTTDCALCELHPGEADGLDWDQYLARFEAPNWDADPARPIAPGGEGWTGFVGRAAAALERVVSAHEGETAVVVTHAGVIEASMLRFLPVDPSVARLGLHTAHTSLTVWQRLDDADVGRDVASMGSPAAGGTRRRWLLERYNDTAAT